MTVVSVFTSGGIFARWGNRGGENARAYHCHSLIAETEVLVWIGLRDQGDGEVQKSEGRMMGGFNAKLEQEQLKCVHVR